MKTKFYKIVILLLLLIPLLSSSNFGVKIGTDSIDESFGVDMITPSTIANNVTYYQNITNNYYNITQGTNYTNVALTNITNTFIENQIFNGNITASYFCDGTSCYNIAQLINGSWISVAESDLNMSSYSLTDVGELFMQGLITSEDIIPTTHNLYKLGNSSNWFSNLYVTTIEAINITSEFLNSTSIESKEITSQNISSKDLNISNELSISGYSINEEDDYLTFKLKG